VPARPTTLATLGLVLITGCGDSSGPGQAPLGEQQCTIDPEELLDGGVGRDGIPSLQNPTLVGADHPDAGYLRPDDRVVGLELEGRVLAIPTTSCGGTRS